MTCQALKVWFKLSRVNIYINDLKGNKNYLELAGGSTGNPGSVIALQYRSSKITVFVWGENTILKFVGNTK